MVSLAELKRFAREAARILGEEPDLAQFEIYCSSAEQLVMRLNYTSEVPSRGVEECKSLGADGFAIRIVPRRNPYEIGASYIAGDLSAAAIREALVRARRSAVVDPHFQGLPEPRSRIETASDGASDLIRAPGARMVAAAWGIVANGIDAFVSAQNDRRGLVLGGDLTVTRDRFAIASSNFEGIRAEPGAYFTASVTALVESIDSRATTGAVGASASDLSRIVPPLGGEAVRRALALGEGEQPAPGRHRVLLGPQPVAEILCYLVVPSLTTGAFHSGNSAYLGRFGDQVIDRRISLADEPSGRARAISRHVTCEGMPARRSALIRDGRLADLLSSHYDAQRLAQDEHQREKLGPHAPADTRFHTANGYRLGEGGGRRFDSTPGTAATNIVMHTRGGIGERELIAAVGDGIYVGRVWYTYPINGQRAGDFTCTVTGDSYLIRNGRIARPLKPNCLRINANLDEIFRAPIAVGRRIEPVTVWGSPEIFYAGSIACDAIDLSAVGSQA